MKQIGPATALKIVQAAFKQRQPQSAHAGGIAAAFRVANASANTHNSETPAAAGDGRLIVQALQRTSLCLLRCCMIEGARAC